MRKAVCEHIKMNIVASDVLARVPSFSDFIELKHIYDIVSFVNKAIDAVTVYTICDNVLVRTDSICVDGINLMCGKKIVSLLVGSHKIAVVICTLGQAIMNLYTQYRTTENYLDAYLCDTIANIAIEKLSTSVRERLYKQEALPYSWGMSSNFSPGDNEWDIKEQNKILSLFSELSCPVTLTSSCLMQPLKSLSFMVGIGPGLHCTKSKCQLCGLKECSYKKQIKWK